MSWRVVAHKDVRDAVRSRTVWAVFAVLAVAFVGWAIVHGRVADEEFPAFLNGLAGIVGVLLPIVGILLGYKSVAGERQSGSVYLSLSFPISRLDFLVGKVVGRSIVLLVPTLVALLVAGVVGAALYGTDGVVLFPWFLFATALYGLAFLGIAVGLSTSTTVDRWITFGAIGGYLLLVQLWDNVHSLTLLILHRFQFDVLLDMPHWALLFRLVKPSESYYRLLRAGFDIDRAGRYVGEGVPPYVDWWMALLLLCAWIVVPLAIGYWRFETDDL